MSELRQLKTPECRNFNLLALYVCLLQFKSLIILQRYGFSFNNYIGYQTFLVSGWLWLNKNPERQLLRSGFLFRVGLLIRPGWFLNFVTCGLSGAPAAFSSFPPAVSAMPQGALRVRSSSWASPCWPDSFSQGAQEVSSRQWCGAGTTL